MISYDASRLGMNELLPNLRFAHEQEVFRRGVLEIKLHRLPKRGKRFVPRSAEGRDIDIEALRNEKLLLPIQTVGDGFHAGNLPVAASGRNDV